MKKFSNIKSKTGITSDKSKDVEWSNDHISIINYKDWTIIKESDFVVCIIYLIEENQFILRNELIPTFEYKTGQGYHITALSGAIEQGEMPERALLREIEEEAGIVIRPDFKIGFMKPLFISKGHSSQYHPALLTLTERDYHEIKPTTDGSKVEKLSKCVKLDIKYVNSVNASDLITDYMLEKFREYINSKA